MLPGLAQEHCNFSYACLTAINVHAAANKALKQVMEQRGHVAARGPRHLVMIIDDLSDIYGGEQP